MKHTGFCSKCGGALVPGKRQWTCPPCGREYRARWNANNAVRVKKARAEKYAANRNELQAEGSAYYKKNRKKLLAYKKAQWAASPEESRLKNRASRKNTSVDAVRQLLVEQHGLCRICEKTNGKRALCIDHDHATDKVRGLLCNACNVGVGVGMFKDSPKLLAKAIAYLQETRGE